MLTHMDEGLSLLGLSIQLLISSRNTHTVTPRNNVIPAIWASLSPVTLTHKMNHHTLTGSFFVGFLRTLSKWHHTYIFFCNLFFPLNLKLTGFIHLDLCHSSAFIHISMAKSRWPPVFVSKVIGTHPCLFT